MYNSSICCTFNRKTKYNKNITLKQNLYNITIYDQWALVLLNQTAYFCQCYDSTSGGAASALQIGTYPNCIALTIGYLKSDPTGNELICLGWLTRRDQSLLTIIIKFVCLFFYAQEQYFSYIMMVIWCMRWEGERLAYIFTDSRDFESFALYTYIGNDHDDTGCRTAAMAAPLLLTSGLGPSPVCLFYAIATVFQLYNGSDMIYEMRRRKPEATLLPIQRDL